jgi:tetratricopeptide (TPR) repeat protein
MPLASYCGQVGLDEAAKQLCEQVEHLPSANLELIIQSRLQQAKYYEKQGQFEKALELVGQAEQAIIPGDYTEAKFKPIVYFRTGFLYEKIGQLSPAIRFYRLAIQIAAPNTDFQVNCYRRLTHCLQTQVNQANEKLERLEAANRWMQSSKFWKLRSAVVTVKNRLQGRDRSPSV